MKTCHSEDELAYLRGVLHGLDAKGDIAEIGVWQGGTAKTIQSELPNRPFHLFDTFTGILGNQAEESWKDGLYCCYEEEVRANIGNDFIFHKGDVISRKIDVIDNTFCFVHFDLDIYVPLKDSLPFFYERVTKGGALLISNYDEAHRGVKLAVDEFIKNKHYKQYSRYILLWKK